MNYLHPQSPTTPSTPTSPGAPSFPPAGAAPKTPGSTTNTAGPAPAPSLTARRSARSPDFDGKLREMALPLAPLVQLTTGRVHPAFPASLLGFWLLTDAQLESLAGFYHQRTPGPYSAHYPCPVAWDPAAPLAAKRRRIGRFIGLRGCESPAAVRGEDDILDEARAARLAEDSGDEALRRKLWWYN